ncbi:MAG: hypothetical protein Q4G13_06730 [Moraxella sp.]|nr:hypothetical protein [Moraxella sp.]
MKTMLLETLQNKQSTAAENLRLFEEAIAGNQIQFDDFDDSIYSELHTEEHRWDSAYFAECAQDLARNFSKERCRHLIQIKDKLQKRKEKGFVNHAVESTIAPTAEPKSETNSESVTGKRCDKSIDLTGFVPTKELSACLVQGNLMQIRAQLEAYLNNMDLKLDEYIKSVYYILEKKPKVYEEYRVYSVAKDIGLDEKIWSWDYFNLQQVYLNRNFSLERLLHLINVREALANQDVKEFQRSSEPKSLAKPAIPKSISPHSAQSEQNLHDNHYEETNNNKFFKALAIVGGAVAALALLLVIVR